VLVASGFGDPGSGGSGGGIFAVDGSQVEKIDHTSSMGLSYDGRRLVRILRCRGQDGLGGEAVVYDERGVQRYLRLDEAGAIHDVAWDGDNLVVVSTWHNAVRWFDPGGRVVHDVHYQGASDHWHVNCVTRHDGVWYATMFGGVGPFGAATPARNGAGRIVRLETGETVVEGLSGPHTPRWLEGSWLVCDSATGDFLAIDEQSKRVTRRIPCGDWPRGIAWDDDFLYVGTSRRRAGHGSYDHAEIVVLDRATWTTAERIALPSQEVYDLIFVPRSLIDGLRRGFDVNALRTAEFRQYRVISELCAEQPRSLWPSGEPLPWNDFRSAIECTLPPACMAGTLLELHVRLTNRSRSFFTNAPPAPIYVSYKWLHPATGEYLTEARAHRSPLPRTVYPGEAVDVTAFVAVPAFVGPAILRIAAMQEGVSWFDDQDAGNGIERVVEIAPAEPPDPVPIVR
jgi:acetolactate synthase I/II/III large subunit